MNTFLRDVDSWDCSVVQNNGSLQGYSFLIDAEILDDGNFSRVEFCSILNEILSEYRRSVIHVPNFSAPLNKTNMDEIETVSTAGFFVTKKWWLETSAKTLREEWNGDLVHTLEREIQSRILGATNLDVRLTFSSVPNAPTLNNRVGFSFIGCRSYPLRGFRCFVEWSNGSAFRSDCFSCQAGTQQIMQALNWMDGAVFVSRETLQWEQGDNFLRAEVPSCTFGINRILHKIIIIDKPVTIENIASWFAEQFRGSLEAAHVNRLWFSQGLDQGVVLDLGY